MNRMHQKLSAWHDSERLGSGCRIGCYETWSWVGYTGGRP